VYPPSQAYANFSSIRAYSASVAPMDVNAKMLYDLTLIKTIVFKQQLDPLRRIMQPWRQLFRQVSNCLLFYLFI
jgi:hypothetical protein